MPATLMNLLSGMIGKDSREEERSGTAAPKRKPVRRRRPLLSDAERKARRLNAAGNRPKRKTNRRNRRKG